MPTRHASAANLALLAIGVLGVSMAAPLIAYATMVPALAMAMWRGAIAAGVMAPYAWATKRDELRSMHRRDLWLSALAGALLAAHFAFWIASLKLTTVASSTALVSMQAAWVVVLTRARGHHVPPAVWAGLALAIGGVLVITGVDFSTSRDAIVGDALALIGGLWSALYTMIGGSARSRISTTSYTLVCYTASAIVMVPVLAVTATTTFAFGWRGWAVVVAITCTSQLLGHSVFNHLLAVMSPTEVTLAILLEVPGASIIAAVFLGQAPPTAVYVGLVFILAGLAIVVRAQGSRGVPPEAAQA